MSFLKNYQLIRVTSYGLRVFEYDKKRLYRQINSKSTSFLPVFNQLATRNPLTRNLRLTVLFVCNFLTIVFVGYSY